MVMIANRDLAERARVLAARAPNGSLERKAYGCTAVALATTATIAAARKVLGAELAGELRAAALEAFGELTADPATGRQGGDHRFCPVLEAVRARSESGEEDWGTLHVLPPVADEATARDAVQGLYEAGDHTARKRGACGSQPLSIKAGYEHSSDGVWSVRLRVFPAAELHAQLAEVRQAD